MQLLKVIASERTQRVCGTDDAARDARAASWAATAEVLRYGDPWTVGIPIDLGPARLDSRHAGLPTETP